MVKWTGIGIFGIRNKEEALGVTKEKKHLILVYSFGSPALGPVVS